MSSDDGTKGAAHDECVVTPNEDSHEEEATWNPFEEFHDEVELSVVPKVMQADGMPSVSAPYDDDRSDIPPFGPDTLICMGVFTEFVYRDNYGYILARVSPDKVERTPSGAFIANVGDMKVEEGKNPNLEGWGDFISVEPIRPPCEHYVRQLAPYYLNPKHKKAFRLCAARRTTEGTFMDVSDMGMYSCDMRSPMDAATLEHIDKFDALKMRQGSSRRYLPLFKGVKSDDEKQGSDEGPDDEKQGSDEGPGGIFG